MSTVCIPIPLNSTDTGLTLTAQLIDTAGADSGDPITTGFVEVGGGRYMLTTTLADDFQGGIKVLSGTTLKQFYTVNPETFPAGPVAYVYTLTDSGTGLPIASAKVWASTDATRLNVVAYGVTDALGQVTFDLDPGLYYFWRSKAGYSFLDPDTESVS